MVITHDAPNIYRGKGGRFVSKKEYEAEMKANAKKFADAVKEFRRVIDELGREAFTKLPPKPMLGVPRMRLPGVKPTHATFATDLPGRPTSLNLTPLLPPPPPPPKSYDFPFPLPSGPPPYVPLTPIDGLKKKLRELISDPLKEKLKLAKNTFMELGKSSLNTFVLAQMMKLLEALMLVLKPVEVLFDVLAGILKVLAAEVMKELFEAMKPVYAVFLDLAPILKIVGRVIGVLVRLALVPMTAVFKVLGALLEPLVPYLNAFADALDVLNPIIDGLTDAFVGGMVWAFKLVYNTIVSIVNGLIWLINLLPGVNIPSIELIPMAHGGVAYGPTPALIGENGTEFVFTTEQAKALGEVGVGGRDVLYVMQENAKYSKALYKLMRDEVRSKW